MVSVLIFISNKIKSWVLSGEGCNDLLFWMPKIKSWKEKHIMIYGYAKISTKTQTKDGNSLEAQENALRASGAVEVYMDAFTRTKSRRPELDKLLAVMQLGDTSKVTKLDRIARCAT